MVARERDRETGDGGKMARRQDEEREREIDRPMNRCESDDVRECVKV